MPQPTNPQNAQPAPSCSAPRPRQSGQSQQDPYINLGPGLQAKSSQELAEHVARMNLGGMLGDAGRRIEKAVGRGSAPTIHEYTYDTLVINGGGGVQVPSAADSASILRDVGNMLGTLGSSLSQAGAQQHRPTRSHPSAQSGHVDPPLRPRTLNIISGSILPPAATRGGPQISSKRPPPRVQTNVPQRAPQPQQAMPARPKKQTTVLSTSTSFRSARPDSTAASSNSTTIFTPTSTQVGSIRGQSVDPRFPPSKASSASTSFATPPSSHASGTGRISSGTVRGPVDTSRKLVPTNALIPDRRQGPSSSIQLPTGQQRQPLPLSQGMARRTSGSQQSSGPFAASIYKSPALRSWASNASLSSSVSTARGGSTDPTRSSGFEKREQMNAQQRMDLWLRDNSQRAASHPFEVPAKENALMSQAKYDGVTKYWKTSN